MVSSRPIARGTNQKKTNSRYKDFALKEKGRMKNNNIHKSMTKSLNCFIAKD